MNHCSNTLVPNVRRQLIRQTRFDSSRFQWTFLLLGLFGICGALSADEVKVDPTQLTLDRIFDGEEFKGEDAPVIQWMKRRGGYTTLEKPSGKESGRDLVWNDPATGKKEILVPAHRFAPGEEGPLSVEGYSFSDDESKLLIATNGKRVWRLKTRGDFWVLDIAAGELKKLGGNAEPATLMFTTFSPDASRVAFVRENNLYVQDLRDMTVTVDCVLAGQHERSSRFSSRQQHRQPLLAGAGDSVSESGRTKLGSASRCGQCTGGRNAMAVSPR